METNSGPPPVCTLLCWEELEDFSCSQKGRKISKTPKNCTFNKDSKPDTNNPQQKCLGVFKPPPQETIPRFYIFLREKITGEKGVSNPQVCVERENCGIPAWPPVASDWISAFQNTSIWPQPSTRHKLLSEQDPPLASRWFFFRSNNMQAKKLSCWGKKTHFHIGKKALSHKKLSTFNSLPSWPKISVSALLPLTTQSGMFFFLSANVNACCIASLVMPTSLWRACWHTGTTSLV